MKELSMPRTAFRLVKEPCGSLPNKYFAFYKRFFDAVEGAIFLTDIAHSFHDHF